VRSRDLHRLAAGLALACVTAGAGAAAAQAYVYWGYQAGVGRADMNGTANPNLIPSTEPPLAWANSVAVSGTHLYWADVSDQTIGWSDLNGQNIDSHLIRDQGAVDQIAISGDYIYWDDSDHNTIGRANLRGGDVDRSFVTIPGPGTPSGVAVADGYIYWSYGGGNVASSIGRASLDGTNVDNSFISLTEVGYDSPGQVAANQAGVYWTNYGADTVGHASLSGSDVNEAFITGAGHNGGIDAIAADASHVYWANPGVGTIGRANLDGTGVDERFIETGRSYNAVGIAVDGRSGRVRSGPLATVLFQRFQIQRLGSHQEVTFYLKLSRQGVVSMTIRRQLRGRVVFRLRARLGAGSHALTRRILRTALSAGSYSVTLSISNAVGVTPAQHLTLRVP
jgi:hypothetical protein